jgi:hypothetical protein
MNTAKQLNDLKAIIKPLVNFFKPHCFVMDTWADIRRCMRSERVFADTRVPDIQPCDVSLIVPALLSGDPDGIKSGLEALDLLLTSHLVTGADLSFLADAFPDILQALTELSTGQPPFHPDGAGSILARLCSVAPGLIFGVICPDVSWLVSMLLSEPGRLEGSFAQLKLVMGSNSDFKLKFMQSNGWQFLASLVIANIPPPDLILYSDIVAVCIRSDFPEPFEFETIVALLNKLLEILANFSVVSPESLENAVVGCFFFVRTAEHIPWFVSNNYHNLLVTAFPAMSVSGQSNCLGVFGRLFEFAEIASAIAGDIPLSFFVRVLQEGTTIQRTSAVHVLSVFLASEVSFVPQIVECGLYELILHLIQTGEFSIRQRLFSLLMNLIIGLPPSILEMFLEPGLLGAMQEGLESCDPEIVTAIIHIAAAFQTLTIADPEVADFFDSCLSAGDD